MNPQSTANQSLQLLKFETKPVRLHIDATTGEILLAGADICRAIGIRNSRQALSRLKDKHRKTVISNDIAKSLGFSGQNPAGLLINPTNPRQVGECHGLKRNAF